MSRYRRLSSQIAALPSQRRLGWLCDWLHVLPNDPLIAALTEEQVSDLWLQFCHLHPERVNKPASSESDPEKPSADGWQFSGEDDEFEAFAQELAEETAAGGILYPGTRLIPHGAAAPVFVEDGPSLPAADEQWEDVPLEEE